MGSFSRQEAEPGPNAYDSGSSDGWTERKESDRQSQDDGGLRSLLLAKAVEYEIIPRLMLAHRFPHECSVEAAEAIEQVSPEDVLEFARLVLNADDAALQDSMDGFRNRGIPVQALFLDLLAPVARHLGELWERDLCNFTEVTVGLGRLQQVLRDNSAAFGQPAAVQEGGAGRRILLVPCPGEQHTFGLSLVAEFFHCAGWDVSTNFLSDKLSPAAMAKQDWYDVVGFSLGSQASLERLAHTMQEVRQLSQNPRVSIIAGGAIFALHPEYAAQISADAIITDGSAAPELANRLVNSSTLQA